MFSMWGPVSPVRTDYGIDLYCTLTERVGQLARVRDYFSVQVKSTEGPWNFNDADSVKWRAIEQGLQPEREIERYQQYRSAVRAILERYDEAPSQAAKIEIMREMERLSFDEMRNFLITNERSRFVM
jgi:Domain of unknown function (DUF4365)